MTAIVGIDASRYAVAQRTGTETYSWELLRAIARLPHLPFDIRWYVNHASTTPFTELAGAGEVRTIPSPRLWTHLRLSAEMAGHRPDLLFVPSHVIPLLHPRSVVTVHDLGYLHEPGAHPAAQRHTLDLTTRWNARARQIIAISATTRQDLIERYRTPPDRIAVIHHGVGAQFKPASSDEISAVRHKYALPDQFVLALGTIQPRKNLARLAGAVAGLDGVALVTAGRRGWMADDVVAGIRAALPEPGRWIETGYVSTEDAPALISAASALALVSTYEGFGLPVLEAMACATPVVISDTPALVEIAGGAARIAASTDVDSIRTAVASALATPRDVEPFVARGLVRAAAFSWDACAAQTVDLLARTL
jgi:glycosyltransferase involved in cell wall biosynthesis